MGADHQPWILRAGWPSTQKLLALTPHIHPIFDRLVQRAEREARLAQRAKVIWLTGLSGSGKSTIAQALERRLFEAGFFAQVLDGDNIRAGINSNLGFSATDRTENIRRIAEVAKLYLHSGIITINAFISPTRAMRQQAAEVVGLDDFVEVYINAPLAVCESRDVKGLYQKARQGLIQGFTGIDEAYEPPLAPAMELRTAEMSPEAAVDRLLDHLRPLITIA